MTAAPTFDAAERVLVIGLGKSGRACVRVLSARGATVLCTDEKPPQALAEALAEVERLGAHFVAPEDLGAELARLRVAVLSPGVPPSSAVLTRVREAGVPVVGEIEVAYRLARAPLLAITGTKGKSTTTALIGHLLRACGRTAHVGGNIGNPLIEEAIVASQDDWIVAEVSSFQLETIQTFRPRVAVLLNVAPDHLDRYASLEEYAEAKFRIVANQSSDDWFVGNLDDPRVAALREGGRLRARQRWFTLGPPSEGVAMYVRDDVLHYVPDDGAADVPIVTRHEIPLAGEHNVQNAMAALLATLALGCDPQRLREGIASFRPMHHRLESVGEVGGVLYVNDSKATNPDAAIAALQSYDRPIVLIAGGRAKGTSFAELGTQIRRRVKILIAIGEASDAIVEASRGIPAIYAASLEEAVKRAQDLAKPGEVVLLSPGCASFDMFASAEERGERFTAAVAALRGAVRA